MRIQVFTQIPITLNLSHIQELYRSSPLTIRVTKNQFHPEPVGIFIIYLHTKFHMHRFDDSLVIPFKLKHKHRYPTAFMFSYSTRKSGIKKLITIQNSRALHHRLRSRKFILLVMLALLVAGN